jgi:hypothetical protein
MNSTLFEKRSNFRHERHGDEHRSHGGTCREILLRANIDKCILGRNAVVDVNVGYPALPNLVPKVARRSAGSQFGHTLWRNHDYHAVTANYFLELS